MEYYRRIQINLINVLRLRKGGNVPNNISEYSGIEIFEFRSKFYQNILHVQLTKCQHWFRQWLDAGKVTSCHLNGWWSSLFTKFATGLNVLMAYVGMMIKRASSFSTQLMHIQMFIVDLFSTVLNQFKSNSVTYRRIVFLTKPYMHLVPEAGYILKNWI